MASRGGYLCVHLSVLLSAIVTIYSQEIKQQYSVREEQDIYTFVGNVAKDSLLYGNVSMDVFQRMKFLILTQGNQYASMFSIEETTSTLRTAQILDRESVCPDEPVCELSFSVAVYLLDKDTAVPDLYRIIKIIVNLQDINDNAPAFPNKEVNIPISENSPVNAEYFTNGAVDLDTGANNSVQNYRMEPANETFGLKVLKNPDGSSDLNIVVNHPLDRETRGSYQLVIFAEDGGFPRRTGSVKVNITITDQNDNAPIFSEPLYNVTIEENTPVNSTIVIITATDSDASQNGEISYRFSTRTSPKILEVFTIKNTTGEITSKDILDFEDRQNWTFKIEALDHGSPPKVSSVDVIINIADTNDNYPQININLPPGGTKISEAADTGSFVAHVAVFDRDAVNNEIQCSISGDDFRLEDFKIANNYKVVLNKPLDHEVRKSYEVTIHCQDGGAPPKSNSTTFPVTVEDINDNFPEFTSEIYNVTLLEETSHLIITQVTATDKDSGNNGKITYGLHPDDMDRFTINYLNGLITSNTRFDREEAPEVYIRVMAWDAGEVPLTSTATVVIYLTDLNDNAPIFPSNPVEIVFNEEVDVAQTASLGVRDPDFGLNGQFVLTFPSNDYLSEYFSFSPETGEIKTRRSIDREEVTFFKFEVTAVDKGTPRRTSSAEVIIHIKDSNDNIPAIRYPHNGNKTRTISVSAPVGYLIATVLATDRDEGVNAQLLYFIEDGDLRNLFKMDVNTGRLSVAREMGDLDADEYNLEIAVRDNGKEQRTSYATLQVIVQPLNETVAAMAEENRQNILIVVVIVVVTVVLSITIIATIFIIRHIDRRNRPVTPPKMMENRFYETAKADESMSASSNVSKDSDTELLKKRAKKEVSFSIDDESCDPVNNSTLTNVTSFTTMKTLPSYMSMDYKGDDTQSTTWLCNNTFSSGDLSKTDLYNEKELSGLTHSQLQQALHQIHNHPDKLWLQPVREEEPKNIMNMMKKADDNHSETSHETTTSDSGRGGSEEDIHSNRGHTLSDNEDGKHYHQRVENGRHKHHSKHDKFLPRRPPPPIPVDNSYTRNISFSDDSVTANTTVASYKKPHSNASSSSSMFKTPVKNSDLFTITGRTGNTMFYDSQLTTPGMAYSVADIEDMSEMAVTCRDDASTTTSGSYTINPDDLCNEIDELFFKDVIV